MISSFVVSVETKRKDLSLTVVYEREEENVTESADIEGRIETTVKLKVLV